MLRRIPPILLPVILVLLVMPFLMLGCSSDSTSPIISDGGDDPDTTAPTLVSTNPAAGSTGLTLNQVIVATFSEPLDPASLTGNITLTPGTVTDLILTGSDVQIVHNPFNFDDEITITFAVGITDTAGNHLAAPVSHQYWVRGDGADTTPPTLLSTDPAADSTDLDINQVIVASFSEPLDPASLTGNITISPGTVTDLVLTGNDVQIVHNPFNYDDEITITFAIGITDTAGNHLTAPVSNQYWVGADDSDVTPPTLLSTDPSADSNDLQIDQIIIASFSEPLAPSSINGNITITPGTVTDLVLTGNNVQILHSPFHEGDEITITFAVGLTDTAGNHLAEAVETHYSVAYNYTGYYASIDPSTPESLRLSLHELIDDHTRFPYTASTTDTWDILEEADQDPNDAGHILDLYGNYSYIKHGGGNTDYNREHTWPSSYGFTDDGSTVYPYTDCHHLFLCNDSYNSSRGNKPYGNVGGSETERPTQVNDGVGGGSGTYPGYSNWYSNVLWETWIDRRGDVARALFYLDVRYEGGNHGSSGAFEPDLVLTDDISQIVVFANNTSGTAYMGLLSDLLSWHEADPVDAKEIHRNEVVFSYQGNRNPFIDHPELVDQLFGP